MRTGLAAPDRPHTPTSPRARSPRSPTTVPAQDGGLEAQADRAGALAYSGGAMSAASLLAFGAGPQLQRKCACGGTCEKCGGDEENLRIQRKPDESEALDEPTLPASKRPLPRPHRILTPSWRKTDSRSRRAR